MWKSVIEWKLWKRKKNYFCTKGSDSYLNFIAFGSEIEKGKKMEKLSNHEAFFQLNKWNYQ